MAMVRASCGSCGDVEFRSDDVQIRVSAPDGSGTYAYCCPGCQAVRQAAASASTIDLLLAAGGVMVSGELLTVDEQRPTGLAPITHDELLAFHRLLHESDDWMDLLVDD